jgi:hypothetical protein
MCENNTQIQIEGHSEKYITSNQNYQDNQNKNNDLETFTVERRKRRQKTKYSILGEILEQKNVKS